MIFIVLCINDGDGSVDGDVDHVDGGVVGSFLMVMTDDDKLMMMVTFTCDCFYLQKRNTKSVAQDAAGKPTGFLNSATEHGNSSASDDDGKTIKTSGVA